MSWFKAFAIVIGWFIAVVGGLALFIGGMVWLNLTFGPEYGSIFLLGSLVLGIIWLIAAGVKRDADETQEIQELKKHEAGK